MSTPPLPPLAITALSPVATGASFCSLAGVLWATVIVKATLQLVHGEAARLCAAEDLVTSDRAIAPGTSLTSARETMPHLPNAGVLLSGHACAPDGRAVPSMSVRLGLSRDRAILDKTLHVFGARAVNNPGSIAPFQRMPLVYERAHGGAGVWENPVGTGGPGSRVLPNIVDPRDPRKVAGFGPIAPQWAPRRALLQGIDPALLERAPWEVPSGFDWRFFQPAPADQQIERLHGDEWIVLDGMDPSLPRVQSQLPHLSARALRRARGPGGAAIDQTIDLRADMLVIDADRRVASLIWRGRFAFGSMESLEEARVLVALEQPGRPVAWPPLSSAAHSLAGRGAPAAPPAADRASGDFSTATADVDLRAILKGRVPFSPDRESALPSAPPKAPQPTAMSTGTADIDLAQLFKGAALHRGPAALLDKASPLAAPPPTPPAPTSPPAAPFSPPPAAPSSPPPAASAHSPATPARPPVTASLDHLGRKSVLEKLARKEPLDGLDLAGANLSGLDLTGCSLVRADLRGARLRGTKLGGADLRSALLDEADLRGAILESATLDDASLVNADLERARLARCSAERATFTEARLQGADLSFARLANATLDRAVLRDVTAPGADFTSARLEGADARGASLRGARLSSAILTGADLERADLQNATLRGARLEGATLRMTRLVGADLPDPSALA